MLTSNFATCSREPNAVSIARKPPVGYRGRQFMPLAPSWSLVKESDERIYRERYLREVLDGLNPREVLAAVTEDAILLCWEHPGAFCHRRIVAEWFERQLGIVVPEYVKTVSPQTILAGLV